MKGAARCAPTKGDLCIRITRGLNPKEPLKDNHAARDFTTPLMVGSASSLLASNIIFGRYADGKFTESAAMMVALVLFNVCAVIAGRKWIVRAIGMSDIRSQKSDVAN